MTPQQRKEAVRYLKPSRPTKESCSLRNRYILRRAVERYIPHVAAESSLAIDLENHLLPTTAALTPRMTSEQFRSLTREP